MEAAHRHHRSLARRAGARIAAAAAVTIALAVWSVGELRAEPPRPGETIASGVLSQSNSRDGSAILTAEAMKPGDTASGSVTIANSGDLAGEFSLSASNLTDAQGPNGGSLSQRLELEVVDVTDPGAPATLYSGRLGDYAAQAVGTWPGGAAHSYRFAVRFPEGGTAPSATGGDNAYLSSSASVQFNFTATSVAEAPSEVPAPAPPTPAPSPASPRAPAPAAPAPPTAGPRSPTPTVTLTGRKVQRMKRQRGKVWLVARCNTRCSHRLSAPVSKSPAVKKAAGRASLASRSVAAGVPLKLSFKLDRRARAAIAASHRRGRTVVVRVTVVTSYAGAGTSKRTWSMALKP